jgi:trans-2,3-dihydro-3-hydroxyanthranilate isomerase
MTIPFYIVDVFAENKYSGNQLAVFLDADKLSDEEMIKITREINFAESTFVTAVFPESAMATIRIFTPQHEMQFAGHPIIGTSWVLMNKVLDDNPQEITLSVPIGYIPVFQETDLVWLQAAQPEFLNTSNKEDFLLFSNLNADDFDSRFPTQEVSTGSAFVIVVLKSLKILENLNLDKDKMDLWLRANCCTNHRALYFFCLEDQKLNSRMFCIENNQLVEDAATGSASSCLQAFLLKYHSSAINTINYQGDFINRPSEIYLNGIFSENHFDIRIGGKTKFIAKGEWEV